MSMKSAQQAYDNAAEPFDDEGCREGECTLVLMRKYPTREIWQCSKCKCGELHTENGTFERDRDQMEAMLG
jgi:hypothetical protein